MSENLVELGSDAFFGTPWIEKIAKQSGLIYLGKLLYKYNGTMPQGTTIEIKEGTKRIGDSAFSGCEGLISVVIPNSVESIGSSAFQGCRNLSAVNIPDGVTVIGYRTFYKCNSLTSITIPSSVTNRFQDFGVINNRA